MKAIFEKCRLSGTVKAPPSKSAAHRLVIASCLAKGTSTVRGVEYSEDISATLDCASALGARVVRNGDSVTVDSVTIDGGGFLSGAATEPVRLYCRESGSTLRFFIPLAMLTGRRAEFYGSERLLSRPLTVYEQLAHENSILFEKKDDCITVLGNLPKKNYELDGSVSSQFISGLLFALVRLGGGSIRVIPPFESRPYVEMTVAALRTFGAEIDFDGNVIAVRRGELSARDETVEGDWSNAAFLDAFNLIGGDVAVTGLNTESGQGDKAYREYFASLETGTPTIDLSDTPDLAPILFAMAGVKNGAVFTGTHRLAAKESDRAAVMAHELAKFGVRVDVGEDTVTVHGGGVHAPSSPIEKHSDHRIVMACSTLLTLTGGQLIGAEDVSKSFPSYFETIKKLGAKVEIV